MELVYRRRGADLSLPFLAILVPPCFWIHVSFRSCCAPLLNLRSDGRVGFEFDHVHYRLIGRVLGVFVKETLDENLSCRLIPGIAWRPFKVELKVSSVTAGSKRRIKVLYIRLGNRVRCLVFGQMHHMCPNLRLKKRSEKGSQDVGEVEE